MANTFNSAIEIELNNKVGSSHLIIGIFIICADNVSISKAVF